MLPTRARVMLKHRECATHTLPSARLDCFTSGGPPPPYRTVCWSNAVRLCSSFASEVLKSISEAHTATCSPRGPVLRKGRALSKRRDCSPVCVGNHSPHLPRALSAGRTCVASKPFHFSHRSTVRTRQRGRPSAPGAAANRAAVHRVKGTDGAARRGTTARSRPAGRGV